MIGYDRRMISDKFKEENNGDNDTEYIFYAVIGMAAVILLLMMI